MRDLAQVLASALRRPTSAADEQVPPEAKAAAVVLLAATIRRQVGRRRVRVAITGLMSVAAVAVGFVTAHALLTGPSEGLEVESAHLALVTHGAASVAASKGERLDVGTRVETASGGSMRMRFPTGSQVWLEEHSALELLSTGIDQNLRLSAGRVLAAVAPLEKGQRFRIVTADSELEVRGTRFVVEWLAEAPCPGQAATKVRVEEGTVWVRHRQEEAVIHAGGSWPPPCSDDPKGAPSSPQVVVLPRAPSPPKVPSRLAEENRRFGEVLQARQAGRAAQALELLDRLRRDFPRGHLEEDVAAEEMRLAAGPDPARARRAATSYLQRFPRGYARALAEDLVRQKR